MRKHILLACIFIIFATSAFGEYYQYTDKNGKLCFTDDIANVPKDQRDVVKKKEVDYQKTKSVDTAVEQNKTAKTTASPSTEKGPASAFQSTAVELDTLQAELSKIRTALEDERAALEALEPKEGTPNKERLGYSVRVEALNRKITEYENKLKAFNEQVEKFNAVMKQKSENKSK